MSKTIGLTFADEPKVKKPEKEAPAPAEEEKPKKSTKKGK